MLPSAANPSRNDGVTIRCPVCRRRAARPPIVAVEQPRLPRW